MFGSCLPKVEHSFDRKEEELGRRPREGKELSSTTGVEALPLFLKSVCSSILSLECRGNLGQNLTQDDILRHATRLRDTLGRKVVKLKARHVAKHPSAQGGILRSKKESCHLFISSPPPSDHNLRHLQPLFPYCRPSLQAPNILPPPTSPRVVGNM
ncbi:hypothetical protein RHMOL_Rhmol02G0093100 [Rhododendron molle]|uniref:Uncharacterized protein n=1 Tax=Rhododendron molle TaxID=49168 RepID=A0ACC0PNL8_RHOML|nr:hypothetical protein RHMOL_Rhmol02G0093100 [Rhododendron molle]